MKRHDIVKYALEIDSGPNMFGLTEVERRCLLSI